MRYDRPTKLGSCILFSLGLIFIVRSDLKAQQRAADWDWILKTAQAYFSSPTPENAYKLFLALPESSVPIKDRDNQGFYRAAGYLYDHLHDLEKPMQTDKEAIAIAFRLFNVSDGGFSEELYNLLGDLSDTNPRLFLAVLRCNIEHLDVICCGKSIDQFYMEGKKKEHDDYLIGRIRILRSVTDESLMPLIEKCVNCINACVLERTGRQLQTIVD